MNDQPKWHATHPPRRASTSNPLTFIEYVMIGGLLVLVAVVVAALVP